MLSELLLVLAGHPSSFFTPWPPSKSTTLRVAPTLAEHLHPGEEQALNTLGQLAFQYTHIRDWARRIQQQGREAILDETLRKGKGRATDETDTYMATLASSLLDVLREYELLVVELESDILRLDGGTVQDEAGFVPLSILLAKFSPWQSVLAALADLVDSLARPIAGTSWTPGRMLSHLGGLINNGNARLREVFQQLYTALLRLFLTHLVTFLLSGIVPAISTPTSPSIALDTGPDPLSPQHRSYKLNADLFPAEVGVETQGSILYVGRVAATLKREKRSLPRTMIDDLRQEILKVDTLDDGLERAIRRAREEVGEWLWKHVLTGPQVIDALESLCVLVPPTYETSDANDSSGDYFLTRNAEYTLSLIREVDRLRMDKLILSNPHSSSSVIREQDLNLAILRASVGTGAEADRSIEKLRFKLERGSLRPFMPSATTPKHSAADEGGSEIRSLFSSYLLGAPMTMTTTMGWPMDLFITPPALAAYVDVNVYLTAIRDTHLRVCGCWSSLSASQRRRRKWTGSTEGGTKAERDARQRLARSSWGLVRAMLFFLDHLLGHFMVDIIDVQHRRLLERLDEVNVHQPKSLGTTSSRPGSMRGSIAPAGTTASAASPSSRLRQAESPIETSSQGGFDTQTIRSKPPPTSARSAHASFLDFLSLRSAHPATMSRRGF